MEIRGFAHVFGDDIDTDAIIPARHLNTSDPDELAKHCMEDADPDFVKKYKQGDFIVAGKNFGCGSSREHAPLAIKAAGLAAVIADSYARIFYRNAINIGLPILESPEGVKSIKPGDELAVDMEQGRIRNLTRNESYPVIPYPPFMQELMTAGGLLPYVAKKVGN